MPRKLVPGGRAEKRRPKQSYVRAHTTIAIPADLLKRLRKDAGRKDAVGRTSNVSWEITKILAKHYEAALPDGAPQGPVAAAGEEGQGPALVAAG